MGKINKKDAIIISGFNIKDNNRGTAALSYGAIPFLKENADLKADDEIIVIRKIKNPFKKGNRKIYERNSININGTYWLQTTYNVSQWSWNLALNHGILLPFSRLKKIIARLKYVAAINGGDGFSDIYSTRTFLSRLPDTLMAMKYHIPVIQLPQTLGPFNEKENYNLAKKVLQNSQKVYVRDDKFVTELHKIKVKYELTHDLSYFMHPEPFKFHINDKAIGINVSGLAYSNKFRTLSGQFENYPYILKKLIENFRSNYPDYTIYLISHSYNYKKPETNNDDMVAARSLYNSLSNKTGVTLVDLELNSPQTKFLISKMKFFVGTRMHANFAAIFTKVPLFGLAYSYKFQGAFEKNGIYNRTAMINNITIDQADKIIAAIVDAFENDVIKKQQ